MNCGLNKSVPFSARESVKAMRAHTIVAAATLVLVPCLAYGWESDVHFGLTRWLATQAGFKPQAAQGLAEYDQKIDAGILDAVHLMVHYACIGKDDVASGLVRDHHFPTLEKVNQPPAKRSVSPNGEAALRPAMDRLKNPTSSVDYEMEHFGFALHAVQDSWSHQGIPDVPQVLGFLRCDEGYAWGHPMQRGGWSKHDADETWHWKTDTRKAAEITFDLLNRFLALHPELRGTPGVGFKALENDIEEFQKAKTKTAKKQWFATRGFKDFSFLSGIGIPDGEESFRSISTYWREGRDRVVQKLAKIDIPQDVEKFFKGFFNDWALVKDFKAFTSRYVAATAIVASLEMKIPSGMEPADVVASGLRAWRIEDHGRVAEMGDPLSVDPKQLSLAMANLNNDSLLAVYESARDAYLPVGGDREAPPYLVFPVKDKEGGKFTAAAQFRHTPYDVVWVTIQKVGGEWRVVSLNSTIEH